MGLGTQPGGRQMAKPSRWTAEKRYEIVKEALSQKSQWGKLHDGIKSLKG
jgi:hypothetical protein